MGPELLCPMCDSERIQYIADVCKCLDCGEFFDELDEPNFEAYGRHKTKVQREYEEDND